MTIIALVFLVILLMGIILVFINALKSKSKSAIQIMSLGIEVTLIGGIMMLNSSIRFGGIEYVVMLFGIILSFFSFLKKDKL